MKKFKMLFLSLFLFLALYFQSWAAQINFTLTIDEIYNQLDAAIDYDLFGTGDTYNWQITYSDWWSIGTGETIIWPILDEYFSITGQLGLGPVFQAADYYPYQNSRLHFTDGFLDSFLNFTVSDPFVGRNYYFKMNTDQFSMWKNYYDGSTTQVAAGHFNFPAPPDPGPSVPEPTTILLFGLGLLGLAGVNRKKKNCPMSDLKSGVLIGHIKTPAKILE
ncbi:MAG: PEP-CTERM sorting domain-containing protein [Desulfobacteraceae bacterium]|nr:PEP-CTERM sorting domain-containing protein [Desulfobacteraceae bacterium]